MNRYLKPERFEVDPASGQNSSAQWIHWKKTFDNFIEESKSQNSEIADEVRLKLLVNLVSPSIFEHISNCTTYSSAILTLEKIFIKPQNEIFARYKLANRKQQPGESIDQYLQVLNLLAKDCLFKDVTAKENESASIRDAFISGLNSQVIRERLLENNTLNLDQAYDKARALESAQLQSECYSSQQSILAINNKTKKNNKNYSNVQNECYFCGNSNHPRRFCPAANTSCLKCGKQGHFAKVCKSSFANSVTTSNEISCLANIDLKRSVIDIKVNGILVKALIDTGSTGSFINESIVNNFNIPSKIWHQEVIMASSSLKSKIKSICNVTIQINEETLLNVPLRVMQNLCIDVILGHDILKEFSSIELNFNGPRPNLKLCILNEVNIEPVNLFPQLSSDCTPIIIKSRKFSNDDQEFIRNEIEKLLADGIIEESRSPWRAQVLVTSGTNHKKRMCIDYSQTINKFTYLDAYPLPNIEEVISQVSKFKIFSKIDLKSAYHQIPIISENKPYTAFEANGNLYQFCRIPFGVTNGVACFQRAINSIIKNANMKDVISYLDDITVCGIDQNDHDIKLKKFNEIAEKYNLTINKQKSEFSIKQLNILGYNICNNIVKPDPDRLSAFLNIPVPKDSTSLKRVVGMFAHYSKWVPDFSKKLSPLISVEKFPLNESQIAAFNNLKCIISKSSLSAIDPKEPFIVETDASDISLAASLTQNGRPVAFFSRTLSDNEKKYPIIEKEACAIIECLKKWKHYLLGRHFYLITDQKSVAFMMKNSASKIKNDKIQRWRMELSNYNFDIKYRPGRENVVADALSRQVCANVSENKLTILHKSLCHPGITRLFHFIRSKNLPYSLDDVKKVVSSCRTCAEIKPKYPKYIGNLIKATAPFERLALDFKGPLPSSTKNVYLLTIIDEYSRFPFAYACPNMSAQVIIDCLTDVFSIFGMPAYIHTDQGSSFMSSELRSFLTDKGIAVSRSAPYNPKGNGQVERLNGTLWQSIRLALKNENLPVSKWELVLTQALHSIRSLLCTSTNTTPHERMFQHSRRSSCGQSMPSWMKNGKILMRKNHRNSKYDSEVEEVELIEPNPLYSHIRLANGKELTVSNRQLAPSGEPEDPTSIIPDSMSSSPNHENELQQDSNNKRNTLPVRKSERERRPPKYLNDFQVGYVEGKNVVN